MGKSPKKLQLTILVDQEWQNHPKLNELAEKGHKIVALHGESPHLILSRNAHMWNDSMWPLLDVTMKAARARKKGQNDAEAPV